MKMEEKMKNYNIKEIIQMSDKEIIKVIFEKFKNKNIVTDGENYFYIPGNTSLCMVAHIDTVRDKKKKVNLKVTDNIISNKNGILGADDRAGVYLLLSLYNRLPQRYMPHFLFTNYEESGGTGVKAFCSMYPQLENINLFIEWDRQGADEYVTYVMVSKKIDEYIQSFGYIEGNGSYSDVYDLSAHYKIPSVNCSVGYYHQHTKKEFLVLDILELNLKRAMDICYHPIQKLYKIKEISPVVYDNSYLFYNYHGYYLDNQLNLLEELNIRLQHKGYINKCGDCVECDLEWIYCTADHIAKHASEALFDILEERGIDPASEDITEYIIDELIIPFEIESEGCLDLTIINDIGDYCFFVKKAIEEYEIILNEGEDNV